MVGRPAAATRSSSSTAGTAARIRFPPMPYVPALCRRGVDAVESTAAGVVYSFVRVHVGVSAGHAAGVPYTVAMVELEEGCRMLGRVDRPATGWPWATGSARPFADRDGWTEL